MDSDEFSKPINIKDTINFAGIAWQNVTRETVRDCWINTGILPDGFLDEYLTDDSELVLMLSENSRSYWTITSWPARWRNRFNRKELRVKWIGGWRFGDRTGILCTSHYVYWWHRIFSSTTTRWRFYCWQFFRPRFEQIEKEIDFKRIAFRENRAIWICLFTNIRYRNMRRYFEHWTK